MPLTPTQARDQYIIDSLVQYLSRTVKADYDPIAAATSSASDVRQQYPTAITIRQAKPDDVTIIRVAPSVAVSFTNGSENQPVIAIGDSAMWRPRNVLLSCFPSLDAQSSPCMAAALLLRSLVNDALESEFIRVIDYSNPDCNQGNVIYASDGIYIRKRTAPIDRGKVTALAQEKHRFDVQFSIEYAVQSALRT